MDKIFIIFVIVMAAAVFVKIIHSKGDKRQDYRYKRKDFFMSRAEHECYDALVAAVGQEYHVFAQVHLPTLVEHTIRGQNWRGAFSHINQKSVDFVLCDKAYISPKLVIELDDKTHERPKRKERDIEVERILKDAGLPLLRLDNHGWFNPSELSQKIKEFLANC